MSDCGSGDKTILVCHMILQDHLITGPMTGMGKSLLW